MVALLWVGLLLSAPEANLLANGDFAAGPAAWLPAPELAQHGSFKVVDGVATLTNRGDTATVYVAQRVPAPKGKVLRLTGRIQSGPLRETAGVTMVALDAGGKELERAWAYHLKSWGTGGVQPFEGEYRPPAEAAEVEIRLAIYRPGEVTFAGLVLTAVEPPQREDPWGERLTGFELMVEPTGLLQCAYAVALDPAGNLGYLDVTGRFQLRRTDGTSAAADLGGFPISLAYGRLGSGQGQWLMCAAAAPGQAPLQARGPDARLLWSWPGEGRLPHRATTGDLEGDGVDEVLVTCGNQLIVLSAAGQELWRRDFGGPRQRMAAVGSETGDGQRQVFTAIDANSLFAAAFNADGQPRWRFQPGGGLKLAADEIAVADLDGDGRDEVLTASEGGQVTCISGGELRWLATREKPKLWPQHPLATANLSAAFPQLAVGDWAPERDGLETLVALIDQVWMLDARGKFIWESPSGILLQDLVPGPDGSLYAPSPSWRLGRAYRLVPRGKAGVPLADVPLPQETPERLDRLARQVAAAQPVPAPAAKRSVIFANLPRVDSDGLGDRLRDVDALFRTMENDQLEYVLMLWPKDLPVELHRGPLVPPDKILAAAKLMEALGRPFLFFACHGAAPNLSVEVLKQTLDAAPTACRGFYVAENMEQYGSARWRDFLAWTGQVLELCRARGKQLVFKEMYEAWSSVAALPDVRASILQPQYRDTVVAMYATNNPHAPELQLAGMIGLHHAGRIASWGISTQYWNWSWSEHTIQQHWPNLCPPDVILRMELAAACLGAQWFHVEGGQEYLLRDSAAIDPRALRHREIVYTLIRKGLLPNVPPADHLEFSPLVLARTPWPNLDQRLADGQSLGSAMGRAADSRTGLLGVGETMQTVHDGYLPAILCDSTRYLTSMFPAMPHGWLRSVPDDPDSAAFLADQVALRTDGVSWNGPAPDLPRLVAESDARVGVRCERAAVMALRLPDSIRLFVIDDEYLQPRDSQVTVIFNQPLATATDLLGGERWEVNGRQLELHVPGGGFRVIDVQPAG